MPDEFIRTFFQHLCSVEDGPEVAEIMRLIHRMTRKTYKAGWNNAISFIEECEPELKETLEKIKAPPEGAPLID